MSSKFQINANRNNAQHSTGPKSDAGKAASSQNSFKHGLAGSQIVIPGEDPADYDRHRETLHRCYKPADEAEAMLIDQISIATWRLERAHKIEASALGQLTVNSHDPTYCLAGFLVWEDTKIIRIQRYIVQFERSYQRALRELRLLQSSRAQQQVVATKAKKPNGFVLQNSRSVDLPAGCINSPEALPTLLTAAGPNPQTPEELPQAA